MKPRFACLTLLFLLTATQGLHAQEESLTGGDPEPLERSTQDVSADRALLNSLLADPAAASNDLLIRQIGTRNEINVNVDGNGGPKSQVQVTQLPGLGVQGGVTENRANLDLNGDNNSFSLVQRGRNNVYQGSVTADDLDQDVLQDGNFNEIYQENAFPQQSAEIEIFQLGDGNSLDASNLGTSSRQVTVRQTGGARARVEVRPN